MTTRRWLIIGCTVALLAGLILAESALPTRAVASVSEQYRLVAFEVGNLPVAMQSDSYMVNEGVATQAETAPAMESENYQVSGIVPYRVYLPIVVRAS